MTRVSEGQKDPRNLQFSTYCVCQRVMSALDLGMIRPETVLNLLNTIHCFGKVKITLTCLGRGSEVDCLKSSTKLSPSIRTSESESTLQKVISFLAVALKVQRKTFLGRV